MKRGDLLVTAAFLLVALGGILWALVAAVMG
jgi:hypothetical protein